MKKLLLSLLIFASIFGFFYIIGPPKTIVRLLIQIPGFFEWVCDKAEHSGVGSGLDCFIYGWYEVGRIMRFWVALVMGGVISIGIYILLILKER